MSKQLSLPLICTFVFTVALTQRTYAVDGCSSTSFKVATHINLEAGLFGMAVADFNSDGHLDLIASPNNGASEVLLLLGRGGTQKFGPPTSVPVGGPPRKPAVGDFNGDAKPDLVVVSGDFTQTNTCGGSLAPNATATCTETAVAAAGQHVNTGTATGTPPTGTCQSTTSTTGWTRGCRPAAS